MSGYSFARSGKHARVRALFKLPLMKDGTRGFAPRIAGTPLGDGLATASAFMAAQRHDDARVAALLAALDLVDTPAHRAAARAALPAIRDMVGGHR